ncbi:MAG: type I 3-dehydroquinate dehydratase [Candidatus Jordarchaeales archaeon]
MGRICVSLMADTVEGLMGKVERACEAGADLVELRLDYLRERDVDVAGLVSGLGVPVILTVRRREEGGVFPLGEEERVGLIERCIEAEPDMVDLELSMGVSVLQKLISLCREREVSVILSYHDFSGTPSWQDLRGRVAAMFRLGCSVAKVVTAAGAISDNLQLLGLASLYPQRVVAFCMGKIGVLSRVLCTFFGSPFTYASLDAPLAPGQIDIATMRKVHESLARILDAVGNHV